MRSFNQRLVKNEDRYNKFIYDKQDYLDKNQELINKCKEEELKVMYSEFWSEDSSFHKLRNEFVYKRCPIKTPLRLQDA